MPKINIIGQAQKDRACELVQALDCNKGMFVEIKERKKNKTLPQLGYVFGVMYPFLREFLEESTGVIVTKDELHDYLKRKILGPVFKDIDGDTIEVTPELHNKDQEAWSDYIDRLDKYGIERWGIYFPRPHDNLT